MTIGIAAAGTGGHVYPALAIAEAAVELGTPVSDIVFFGGHRHAAMAVPDAGFDLVTLEVRGLARRVTLDNVAVLAGAARAAGTVRGAIRARRIEVMLAMGGYITGPAALAARMARIPLFLHEQNAIPGLANRWAARLASRVFVAFPGAGLAGGEVVGNPVRSSLLHDLPARSEARARYGLDLDLPVLGVLGGSLGADALNQATARLAASEPPLQILHLAGADQHERWTAMAADHKHWVVIPFEHAMQFFYAAVDGVVSRAGGLAVSELAATGTPAILVPFEGAGGHQRANAAFLAEAGGAVVLEQARLTQLDGLVAELLEPAENQRRAAAAAAVGRPGAAFEIAKALREVAGA